MVELIRDKTNDTHEKNSMDMGLENSTFSWRTKYMHKTNQSEDFL